MFTVCTHDKTEGWRPVCLLGIIFDWGHRAQGKEGTRCLFVVKLLWLRTRLYLCVYYIPVYTRDKAEGWRSACKLGIISDWGFIIVWIFIQMLLCVKSARVTGQNKGGELLVLQVGIIWLAKSTCLLHAPADYVSNLWNCKFMHDVSIVTIKSCLSKIWIEACTIFCLPLTLMHKRFNQLVWHSFIFAVLLSHDLKI